MAQTKTPYRVKGVFLETCNCDSGCNCNFGGFPDHGSCEALVGIKIDEGNIGDVDLSGMKVVLAVKWPKAIHEGDGAAAELAEGVLGVVEFGVHDRHGGREVSRRRLMVVGDDGVHAH